MSTEKKVKRNITCTIRMEVNQEIEISEKDARLLDEHLENNPVVSQYRSVPGRLATNDAYDILYNIIDLEEADDLEFVHVEIEEA